MENRIILTMYLELLLKDPQYLAVFSFSSRTELLCIVCRIVVGFSNCQISLFGLLILC